MIARCGLRFEHPLELKADHPEKHKLSLEFFFVSSLFPHSDDVEKAMIEEDSFSHIIFSTLSKKICFRR